MNGSNCGLHQCDIYLTTHERNRSTLEFDEVDLVALLHWICILDLL